MGMRMGGGGCGRGGGRWSCGCSGGRIGGRFLCGWGGGGC